MSGEVYAKLKLLRDSLGQAVTDADLPPLCSLAVQPGNALALDFVECGDDGSNGMGWVMLQSAFPSNRLPQPVAGVITCSTDTALTAQVGIVRNMPIPDDGEPLDDATYLALAEAQMTEMEVMRAAIVCYYGKDRDVVLGAYTPTGPQGGAVGGYWTCTVSLMDED